MIRLWGSCLSEWINAIIGGVGKFRSEFLIKGWSQSHPASFLFFPSFTPTLSPFRLSPCDDVARRPSPDMNSFILDFPDSGTIRNASSFLQISSLKYFVRVAPNKLEQRVFFYDGLNRIHLNSPTFLCIQSVVICCCGWSI